MWQEPSENSGCAFSVFQWRVKVSVCLLSVCGSAGCWYRHLGCLVQHRQGCEKVFPYQPVGLLWFTRQSYYHNWTQHRTQLTAEKQYGNITGPQKSCATTAFKCKQKHLLLPKSKLIGISYSKHGKNSIWNLCVVLCIFIISDELLLLCIMSESYDWIMSEQLLQLSNLYLCAYLCWIVDTNKEANCEMIYWEECVKQPKVTFPTRIWMIWFVKSWN